MQDLIDNRLWWNGPELLWKAGKDWSLTDVTSKISPDDPEIKRGSVLATQVRKPSSVLEHMEYFSTWHHPKRAVAVCLRLQEKFRSPNQKEAKRDPSDSRSSKYIPVNVQELQNAESEIIKIVQGTAIPDDIISMKLNVCEQTSGEKTVIHDNKAIKKASSLYQLDLFLDANGVLRVGGRIRRSSLSYRGKHPIIYPRKGHLSELIMCHHHRIVEHQGRGITHNEIRSAGYWVIGGSSAVSNHIAQCVKCPKLRGTPQDQKMADFFTQDRLEPALPFTFSAVDYFGPWFEKEGRRELKRYGVLFTCLSSRAIHLEVSNGLDTDSFLNAYRPFVGRRGPVRQLRSHQATNFIGAMNELQQAVTELNYERIREELLSNNFYWVEFKPNVSHASHMGGVWER